MKPYHHGLAPPKGDSRRTSQRITVYGARACQFSVESVRVERVKFLGLKGLYRGYIGIMEQKMEKTILGEGSTAEASDIPHWGLGFLVGL